MTRAPTRSLVIAAVLLAGCRAERAGAGASAPASETSPPAASGSSRAPPVFAGTAGVLDVKRGAMPPALLREVRAGAHEGFDRVVFELDRSVPGYHVEYVDKPVRQCGSGEPTEIAGDAWLKVQMVPAHAHDDKGKATAGERERHPKLRVVREIELTCDFEADVTWVIGVASPNRYRVLELADPPRLVIDIRHEAR